MVNKFDFFKKKYFPKGGDSNKLGVSGEYLDLLSEGFIPPSNGLLLKIRKSYDVPVIETMAGFLNQSIQPLLVASENLSNNASFMKGLRRFDNVSKTDLVNLVSENYSALHVKGRLSTILMNVSNFFILASTHEGLGVYSLPEFNDRAFLRNPFVNSHNKNIDLYDFMSYEKQNNEMCYFVKDEFLPLTVKSIKTNSDNWRKRFSDKSKGFVSPRSFVSGSDFNKVFVEYKKPISSDIFDSLREDVYNYYSVPDFRNLSKGLMGVLFEENLLLSKSDGVDKTLSSVSRPAMSLESDNVVSFYFYPVQVLSHALSSGGGDNYFPGPATLHLANRFQNYVDGRIKF